MSSYLIPVYFVFLAAVWGASFMFMRVGVPEFGAYAFGGLRVGIAGLVLLPLLLKPKRWTEFKANWLKLSVIGIISAALPFTLFAYAAKDLNAGVSSVINASVPMMTGFIAHTFFRDYITKRQFIGLMIGVIGVSLLMFDGLRQGIGDTVPFLAALVACLCYAVGSNLNKRYLSQISPLTIAASGLVASGIATLPLTIATFPTHAISWQAWGAAITIAVLATAVALILFYDLIKTLGPTKTVTVTLLIPVFGIFWGMLLLGEQLTPMMFVGTAIILSGTALTIFAKK